MNGSSRHPGPLVVIGLVVLVAVAAVVIAIAGGDDVSPTAMRVDGNRTTSAALNGELAGFSQGSYFQSIYEQQGLALSASSGSLSSRGTVQWLSYRTQTELARRLLKQNGTPLTDESVNTAKRALAQQGITDGMNGAATNQLARFSASAEALIDELGGYEEYRAAMRRAGRDATVSVDPKYARWNGRRLAFCVPEGCRLGGQSIVPPAQSSASGG
jgi:hypothetical protein